MKLLAKFLQWFLGLFKKKFKPIHETKTIEIKPEVKPSLPTSTRISKSGTVYRTIKHRANKKAHSKAYTQYIFLRSNNNN